MYTQQIGIDLSIFLYLIVHVLYDIHAYKDNIIFPNPKFLAILICAKSASDHLSMHASAHLEM
jgi:hypothetical protein